ncbi:MAG: T9SS type A sorting domain-containing protein [Bacteroidia bacterium]|nr:T9SS type A sorting domain-containing protein [Bacteroidia bacterium]
MSRFIFSVFFLCIYSLTFAQSVGGTIQHGGLTREYNVYVPASYNPANPAPLVINLHGYSSNNWQQELYSNFNPIADTAGFILVYPQGTSDGTGNLFWNVGFFPSNIDDTGFLLALIDTLAAQYNLDQNRIYSTGMSNGGFMSYKLACETDRIAAIASVTGSMTTQTFGACTPSPIPVMQIHGTLDPTVPFDGSTIFVPVPDVVSYWVGVNQCNPTPVMTNVPNTNLLDGATAEHYVYSGGLSGTSVEFYKIINGAHTWPGAPIVIGTTCMDFSASKEIWRFFSQYSSTTSVEPALSALPFSFYPNPAGNSLSVNNKNTEVLTASVLDYTGQEVARFLILQGENKLDIRNLPCGVYIIKLRDKNQEYIHRWVKQP